MARHDPPIIVKRKKVVVFGGHHGGAWKVAYADFVTAMMAFFLLMWLLNATTEDQRKGLADYFNPSIPISRISGGGSAALNGSSVMTKDEMIRDGAGASRQYAAPELREDSGSQAVNDDEVKALQDLERQIKDTRDALESDDLAKHIETRMTPDGLVVELIDSEGTPLFEIGSARPSPLLGQLLEIVAPVLATAENSMQVIGHTDALAYQGDAAYSNWELSADRASISRRLLVEHGLPAEQIVAVIGKASTEPLSADPFDSKNRRIGVLLLARRAEGPRR
ncbi:MAG: OmpA family protein [Parvularculaceae bacterium]|nr:OmpA family protein [Parvularculaceae bacterium]